jgi:putative transposase
MASTRSDFAFALFERVFKEFRQRRAFCIANALFGLSKLSVWWLRLGIALERIKPANPQQNGRHERMHLTLKATKPASFNFLQQQERFDDFARIYNNERPHQALDGACPGEIYTPSARVYRPPKSQTIPSTIGPCGSPAAGASASATQGQPQHRVCRPDRRFREIDDQIWLVSF